LLDWDELTHSKIVEYLILKVLPDDAGGLGQQDVLDHVLSELPHSVLLDLD
jgi:hypothetical protein